MIRNFIAGINKAKWAIALVGLFWGIKYLFFWIDYDRFHILVTLSTFGLYFSIFGSITYFLIRKSKIILANVSIVFILLVLAEFIFYFLSGMPKKEWKDFESSDLPYDHIGYQLGHVPYADSVMSDIKIINGDTIFNAHYSIDKLNRRTTPGHDTSKNKYAVFFGCSVCFGWGLEDNQTLPYLFQENSNPSIFSARFADPPSISIP